jgi:hypothetical protein
MKKPHSYIATSKGIVIDDLRQTTNGAIVPNCAVDLYLPIIGYDGLGIWTMLLRQASLRRNDDGIGDGLKKLARSGRMGYTVFCRLISLLEELGIIKVIRPDGRGRMEHEPGRIEVHDPPLTIPSQYTAIVQERGLNKDFIKIPETAEFLGRTSTEFQVEPPEVPDENSMEVLHGNSTPHGNHGTQVGNHDSSSQPAVAAFGGEESAPELETDTQHHLQVSWVEDGNGVDGRKNGHDPSESTHVAVAQKTLAQAVLNAWHQLAVTQQASGGKLLAPVPKSTTKGWGAFWGVVQEVEQTAIGLGWTADQVGEYLVECFHWKVGELERTKQWKGNAIYLKLISGALASWWREVKAPALARVASLATTEISDIEREHRQKVAAQYAELARRRAAAAPQRRMFQNVPDDEEAQGDAEDA